MTNNIPSVLFRCWSTKSAGGLRSGKLHDGVSPHNFTKAGLLREFKQHKNLYSRSPTAFVSTTSNFLRALHVAYQKIHNEEDERDIKIAFFTTETDHPTKIYPAKDFAVESGSTEEEVKHFENEYIFLWEVPDDSVIHIVSMDLVLQRGFSLPGLQTGRPLPSSFDLRRAITDHGDQLSPFERGYMCGKVACMFGVRAPVYEVALQMSRWVRGGTHCPESWEIVDKASEEAIQERMITVVEDLESGGELGYLMSELSCLEDTHDETIMEIGWELQNCHDGETLQVLLTNEELNIVEGRQMIAGRIEIAYQNVGF